MRRAAAFLGIVTLIPAFAGEPLSVREYEERCASYYARQYGVSPALVRAIIQVESAWQPGVVSSKGAMGLMQLMPATAEHFGVTHPFYIHENVRGGVAYLAELQELFHGDLRLVIAAYAAGERPSSRGGSTIRRQRFTPTFNGLDNSIARIEAHRREIVCAI